MKYDKSKTWFYTEQIFSWSKINLNFINLIPANKQTKNAGIDSSNIDAFLV